MKRKPDKKKSSIIIALLLCIAGLTVMLYPHICQYSNRIQARLVINGYEKRLKEHAAPREEVGDRDGEWDWLYELIVAYNKELYENGQAGLVDVFSYQQVDFSLTHFGFDEEMIGYLTIPKMDIELPIYLGASKENLSKGATHLTQTSLPVGGVNTNAVFAAHRGMSTAAMFRDIETLEIGDEVYITNFGETLKYHVAEIAVIAPNDIDKILIQEGRDLVTLITCHPYRHNYQRYVVYCERAAEELDEANGVGTDGQAADGGLRGIFRYDELSGSQRHIFWEHWIPVCIVAFLLFLMIIILIFKRKRTKGMKQSANDTGKHL